MTEIRPITLDELEAFYTMFFRSMGFGPPSEQQLERDRKTFIPERSLAAFDGSEIVATTYSHPFDLTLPGGAQVPTAGVTAVAAASTHRRQGLSTQLLTRQLLEARERGEVAAILLASEGRIYRRFGYGAATYVVDVRIDTRDVRGIPAAAGGRTRIVDGEVADKIFPDVQERASRNRAGSIKRPQHFWDSVTADRDKRHVNVVFEDPSGTAQGYVRYGMAGDWDHGIPSHKLTIHDMNACTDDARHGLWSYLLNLDLVRTIESWARPVDDPVRWLIAEPRAFGAHTYRDMLWVRPLDAARLLGDRRYMTDVEIALEVDDRLLGESFVLAISGGPDGADVRRSNASPDLRLSVSDLGAISLGGVAPSQLAAAGLIEEITPGALKRADAAFVTFPSPWGDTNF
jgi:predicted acetyltransferase